MRLTKLHEEIVANLPRLRRYAYALTGAGHAADDLAQSTVVRLLAAPPPSDANFIRWMLKVCKNVWIDDLRARRTRGATTGAEEIDRELSVDGAAAADSRMELARVNAAMARLPEEQRAVIALVALEGLSYKEAASVLDIPIGTVMSRLARARVAISGRLSAAADNVVSLRT